jgi:hypothetical protein
MKNMPKYARYILYLIVMFYAASNASAESWDDSPYNWNNSEDNWDNSSSNWDNNPNNWENNPSNWSSDRIIRDNNGDATGYAVPNSNGVTNIYNLDGNREGYIPK